MKTSEGYPGDIYEVANVLNPKAPGQKIKFPRQERSCKTGQLVTIFDGTTTDELLAVLIHRLNHENKTAHCVTTRCAINHLGNAQAYLNKRPRSFKAAA